VTCRNRADVDLDRRRELLAGDWLDGLAEHVVNRELKRFHGDVRILAVQLLIPQSRELFFGQKCVEQGLDRIGAFVPCALLAATEFFVTFLESSHPHYFLTTLVRSSRFVGVSLSSNIAPKQKRVNGATAIAGVAGALQAISGHVPSLVRVV
jgi:hypothetical protein